MSVSHSKLETISGYIWGVVDRRYVSHARRRPTGREIPRVPLLGHHQPQRLWYRKQKEWWIRRRSQFKRTNKKPLVITMHLHQYVNSSRYERYPLKASCIISVAPRCPFVCLLTKSLPRLYQLLWYNNNTCPLHSLPLSHSLAQSHTLSLLCPPTPHFPLFMPSSY